AADGEAEVRVMAPIVTTPTEAGEFAELAHQAGLGSAGVMVETPAAALRAEQVLAYCDFVSIGTNDLTQYVMAADRQLGPVATFNDPWQPAMLQLVSMVAASGARSGKPVGVCGEAAADPLLGCVLVGLGITSLSMIPGPIAGVGRRVGAVEYATCTQAAEASLAAPSAAAARRVAAEIIEPA